ncbi:hypothetical protein LUZ60_009543 [Juncus effusus]|nr:hypothetical protein LUZ60_009543 [Juncus effusus]
MYQKNKSNEFSYVSIQNQDNNPIRFILSLILANRLTQIVLAKMAQRKIRYAVIDAFTNEAYKGNSAAVCYLEENADVDPQWMQNVAREFNASMSGFLSRPISAVGSDSDGQVGVSRFNLRWFTPVAEVSLCGHCTLAAAHFLLTSGIAKHDTIEFVTKSGILTSKKIPKSGILNSENLEEEDKFFIELDFPAVPVTDIEAGEFPSIGETLNGANVVSVLKTTTNGDLVVEVSSAEEVSNLKPNYKELENCVGRGVIITGPATEESGFDFFTRFFCPKFGLDEDPVCGSAHCALVPHWSNKLNKKVFNSFMASQRSGVLYLEYKEESERVLIRGEAVTVMLGTIIA